LGALLVSLGDLLLYRTLAACGVFFCHYPPRELKLNPVQQKACSQLVFWLRRIDRRRATHAFHASNWQTSVIFSALRVRFVLATVEQASLAIAARTIANFSRPTQESSPSLLPVQASNTAGSTTQSTFGIETADIKKHAADMIGFAVPLRIPRQRFGGKDDEIPMFTMFGRILLF